MTLVNNDPGPSVIRSACAIALSVASSGRAFAGISRTDRIRALLLLILVSPRTRAPFASVASSTTFVVVAG